MRSISCCTKPHIFTSFALLKKRSTSSNFFSVAGKWWRKVNKTQRISAKIDLELDSLSEFWIFHKVKHKKKLYNLLWNKVEKKKKWKTCMLCLSFIGSKNSNKPQLTAQKSPSCTKSTLTYVMNSQKREVNFFSVANKLWRKKNKESEHT